MTSKQDILLFKNRSIIKFEGDDFRNTVGIDGRIFKALTKEDISVGVISQQASERGISILVKSEDAERAVMCLNEEFEAERQTGYVRMIYSINNVSVIGFNTENYSRVASELARNNIYPLILNQVAADNRVNIVVTSNQDEKAKNIIETEVFSRPKVIHLAIIGPGNVGKTLIEQILESRDEIKRRKKIELKIFAVANSKNLLLNKNGIEALWQTELVQSQLKSSIENIIQFAHEHQLENVIAVDNTANPKVVDYYPTLISEGFDLVSSNKFMNTLPIQAYRDLRYTLIKHNKRYLYETNVGAGLPLIDTIKLLHLSGENITRIKGVFSGTLSYVFNNFSLRDEKFSTIVREAMDKGYTEPDPREDLSGNDVARKLLILARELDLINEFNDIHIQNLVPKPLLKLTRNEFINQLEKLDAEYDEIKKNQEPNHVLRYVGDLHGDLQKDKGELEVKLISVPANSALGQLKGSDSIFEIYTQSYGENPIVIMGAGAGAQVTARGVFGDILRLSETKQN